VSDQVRAPILCLPGGKNLSESNTMLSGYVRRYRRSREEKISCYFAMIELRFLCRSAHSLLEENFK